MEEEVRHFLIPESVLGLPLAHYHCDLILTHHFVPNSFRSSQVVLELGEGAGGFDLDDAPTISQNQPSFLDAASKAAAAAAKNVKLKAPKNAYDMEKMWRSLKNNEADKAKYLMEYVCANKKLAKLFPNGFQDSVMFDEIVGVLDGVVGADAEVRVCKRTGSRAKRQNFLVPRSDTFAPILSLRCFQTTQPLLPTSSPFLTS